MIEPVSLAPGWVISAHAGARAVDISRTWSRALTKRVVRGALGYNPYALPLPTAGAKRQGEDHMREVASIGLQWPRAIASDLGCDHGGQGRHKA